MDDPVHPQMRAKITQIGMLLGDMIAAGGEIPSVEELVTVFAEPDDADISDADKLQAVGEGFVSAVYMYAQARGQMDTRRIEMHLQLDTPLGEDFATITISGYSMPTTVIAALHELRSDNGYVEQIENAIMTGDTSGPAAVYGTMKKGGDDKK